MLTTSTKYTFFPICIDWISKIISDSIWPFFNITTKEYWFWPTPVLLTECCPKYESQKDSILCHIFHIYHVSIPWPYDDLRMDQILFKNGQNLIYTWISKYNVARKSQQMLTNFLLMKSLTSQLSNALSSNLLRPSVIILRWEVTWGEKNACFFPPARPLIGYSTVLI